MRWKTEGKEAKLINDDRMMTFVYPSTCYLFYDKATYSDGEGRASLNDEGVQKEEQGKQTAYPLRHVDGAPVRKRNPAGKRRQRAVLPFLATDRLLLVFTHIFSTSENGKK